MPKEKGKTLSLAMIVKDEEESLPRCLKSVEGVFDEIVIVDTGSKDRTKEIATSFGALIYDFKWIEDFAAARNFAFSKASCQFVMWLDADDVVLAEDREKILALKPKLGEYDCYKMMYNYSQDAAGNPVIRFFRERIVRNNPPPRWAAPIHECMLIPGDWRNTKTDIVVTHRRSEAAAAQDAGRNLRIIKKAVEADPNDQRMRYYYGKELYWASQGEEAIKQFNRFLEKPGWHEDRVDSLVVLAQIYGGMGRTEDVINTCVRGIQMDPRWAEFYMKLGDIYYNKQEWEKAIPWFEVAAKKRMPDSTGMVATSNYTWLPHDRLSICYDRLGRWREAFEENISVLKYLPGDQRVLKNQDYLRDILFDWKSEYPYRFNLGAGRKPVPSFRSCDLVPGDGVDLVFDLRKLPHPDSTVHAIYCENALEYSGDHESTRGAFKEWARALRHGGQLTLKVPDFDLCCENYVKAEDRVRKTDEPRTPKERHLRSIYGSQRGAFLPEGQSRRTGFTKDELTRLLKQNGFRIDSLEKYDEGETPSLEARATQVTTRISIRWLVSSKDTTAAYQRLRDVSQWLTTKGIDSKIYEAGSADANAQLAELRSSDIVVFTQCAQIDIELVNRLNRCGVSTVFNIDKDLGDQPSFATMSETVKAVTMRSTASLTHQANHSTVLVDDGVQTIAEIGQRWTDVADKLCSKNCNPPKVDIIIPTLNNLAYLKVCIESIRKNTACFYNIIVVNSGTDGTADWLKEQPDVIAVNSPKRLHFSAANNAGLKVSSEKYVCLLNDDTIVSKHWLSALIHEAMKPNVGAVGPLSNGDRGWLHDIPMVVGIYPHGRNLVCGMTMDQVKGVLPYIQKWSYKKEIYDRDWVPFYCVLIPKSAIDKVGLLDEEFKSGDEDVDFCRRLKEAGYICRQTYDSFVFHFGGRTRYAGPKGMEFSRHEAEDDHNHALYLKKWGDLGGLRMSSQQVAKVSEVKGGKSKVVQVNKAKGGKTQKTFVLYTGGAWESWSPKNVNEGGIGGSETCAVYVARDFARKGWKSFVYGNCADREGNYDGVQYIHHEKIRPFLQNKIDLFVSSRRHGIFGEPINADKKVLWVHDIWADANPLSDIHIDSIDKVFVLSPWHKKFFLGHHTRVPEEKVHVTRNGIDLGRFSDKVRKSPGRMIYSSCPSRGLETMLDIMPRIRKEVPDAELHVFYGFDVWEKLAKARGNPDELKSVERVKARLSEPGIIFRGRIGQEQLSREFQKAELWPYPTWFSETFCITAVEAMAAGTPVVTTNIAALDTTVGDTGICVDVEKAGGNTSTPAFRERFAEECVRMLNDRKQWEEYSKRGLERCRAFSWEGIAEEWMAAVSEEVPTV